MTFDPTHFKNHEVTIHEKVNIGGVPFEFLRWQKPGTSWGLINYILKGYELFVTGDWDDAIYAWSDHTDLEWVATLDAPYFNSKCRASPLGRIPKDWSDKECMRQMREQIYQDLFQDVESERRKKNIKDFWEARIKESKAESAAYSKWEWMRWLEEIAPLGDITAEEEARYGITPTNAELFFGEDWVHYHPDGEVIAYTSVTHLEALKLAMAWLKKSKEKWHKGDTVYWTDPDDGKCSRIYNINTIEYLPDDIVRISEPDGSMLECLLSELR